MRIFLSFNSKDKGLAHAIRTGLLKLDSETDIFLDELSLESGFWLPKIFRRIADADSFLFLIGPHGIGQWQEVEYWSAFQRHVEERGQMHLVPVIAADAEAPGLAGLRSLNWIVAPSLQDDSTLHRILTALRGEAIDATSTPLWKLVNPYRGLEAMTEANADYFYGRDAETAKVLSCLAEKPSQFPILIGASGAGKSSIAMAGVLSSLKSMRWPSSDSSDARPSWPAALQNSRGWATLTVRPGDAPIKSLVSAFTRLWSLDLTDPEQAARPRNWIHRLQDNENNLSDLIDATQAEIKKREGAAPEVIFIYLDQAEELYTLANRKESGCFSNLLREGLRDPRLRAFATLRVDDFDLFRTDSSLFECSELIKVLPLNRDQLHKVVTAPSQLLNVEFEDDLLANRLTEAAEREPGALPLLSYQLNNMWLSMVKRGDATLRLPSQAIDVGGVLSSRAEDFLQVNPNGEDLLKRLLTLKLTTVHAEGKPVRRQATRDECSDAEWALASSLADGQWRLVVTSTRDSDGKVVAEVAHEAFLNAWPRLGRWLAEEREFLIFKGDAERKNREWREGGKPDSGLLVGRDLSRADQWIVSRQNDLPKGVVEFLHASRIHENQEQEAQIRLQRRIILGAIAAFLVVAMLSGGLWRFWKAAQEQLQNAQRAESLRLAQLAEQLTHDTGSAMLLAIEALPDISAHTARPIVPEAELQLDRALRNMHESIILPTDSKAVTAVFSPDGNRLITVSLLTTIGTWDSNSGKLIGEAIKVEKDTALQNATFSPDVRRVAMVLDDNSVLVRNLDNNETRTITGSSLRRAAFTHDGKRLVTVSGDGKAEIQDLEHPGSGVKSIQCSRETGIESVEFDPQGTRIVAASLDGPARIFDIDTGQQIGEPLRHSKGISSVAFNSAGTRLLTASLDGTVKVWDADSGIQVGATLEGQEQLTTAKFSPDGQRIATGSVNGAIQLWDTETGALLQVFSGHASGAIGSVAFSPDGKRIVSASDDQTVRVWNIETPRPMLIDRPIGHEGIVRSARFSPNGNQVVTASEDASAIVWDLENHSSTVFKSSDGKLTAAVFDPSGTSIVTASARGTLQIWEMKTRNRQSINAHDKKEIWAVEFSPDGKRLITASEDGTAKVWDFAARKLIYTIDPHIGATRSAAFSPDGKWMATGYLSKTTLIWDARTGKPAPRPKGFGMHNGTVRSVTFSPDSKLIMTASADGSIKIWNAETGESVIKNFGGNDGGIGSFRSAFFSPAGERILTASALGTVRVWETHSEKLIRELTTEGAEAWSATFSPDGERVAIASADHTASVWRVPTAQQLVDQAKATVPRCLTPAERSRFFLTPQPPDWCSEKWPFNTSEWKKSPQTSRLGDMVRLLFGRASGDH